MSMSLGQTIDAFQRAVSMFDVQLRAEIEELVDDNLRLKQEIRQLKSSRTQSIDAEHGYCHQEKQEGDSGSVSIDESKPKHSNACDRTPPDLTFSEFTAHMASLVEEDTPLLELLPIVYDKLRQFIPFQRMGYAEVDYERDRVTAVWHRSDRPVKLAGGYSAPLSTSSLRFVAQRNQPRVLEDLPKYLRRHPNSHSTRLLVNEGFASSLTCPVCADGRVVSFLFLTSIQIDGFSSEHVSLLQEVASHIARAVLAAEQYCRA